MHSSIKIASLWLLGNDLFWMLMINILRVAREISDRLMSHDVVDDYLLKATLVHYLDQY